MEQTKEEHNNLLVEENLTVEGHQADVQEIRTASSEVEEIDSSAPAIKSSNPSSRTTASKEEPIANPLLDDPYEWQQCTITLVYALLPDQTVNVSIYNHKDEPIVKSFVATDVPLPEKISSVMATLQAIWPDSTISATVVFMPKSASEVERAIVVLVRAGNDTPIVQTGVESSLPFPSQINAMLDELKALLPTRALKRIEKDAKAKIVPTTKSATKTGSKPTMKPTTVASTALNKTQLSLF